MRIKGAKPADDRLIVIPDDQEEKTASGIIIADTAKERPTTGTVWEVGPNVSEDICIGDKILYTKWGGVDHEMQHYDGEMVKVVILRETDVLARFEDE